jgi:hypothetical protein
MENDFIFYIKQKILLKKFATQTFSTRRLFDARHVANRSNCIIFCSTNFFVDISFLLCNARSPKPSSYYFVWNLIHVRLVGPFVIHFFPVSKSLFFLFLSPVKFTKESTTYPTTMHPQNLDLWDRRHL